MPFEPLVEVDICGVEMCTNTPSADGATWFVRTVQGWDSAEVRAELLAPTGRHGSIRTTPFFEARELTVEGSVIAPTPAQAWAAWRRCTGLMPGLWGTGEFIVREDIPLQLDVTQYRKHVVFSPVNCAFTFTLNLLAENPFKRTLDSTIVSVAAGDTESLTNDGTAPAYLTVEATGSGTVQLRQDDSGQVLRSKSSVSSGTTFDGTAKRVTSSGGTTLLGVMDNPSEWLSIPPLSTVTVTNQGTAPVDVTFYHSYA